MKKNRTDRCPGCSKHCEAACPRCKYGRAYFAKRQQEAADGGRSGGERSYKWEKYAARDGLAGRLLLTGRYAKQALKSGRATEESLFRGLTAEDRKMLSSLLERIEFGGAEMR